MLAVELHPEAGPARPVVEALRRRGILAKDTHGQTIRFSPPLVIERAEIDWALERIADVLRLIARRFSLVKRPAGGKGGGRWGGKEGGGWCIDRPRSERRRAWPKEAHPVHRRLRQGRPTRRPLPARPRPPAANADLVPLAAPGVDNLTADITDSGQMFDVMTSYANFDELQPGTGVPRFDAVVHFAAVPRILIRPDNETFRINTVGTYNVIEAAIKLGIRKIVIASSETTYGVCFADGVVDPKSLPAEEDYDVDPMDSYGLSKVLNEVTARAFARRSGADIYCLRIGNVIEPHEYDRFPGWFAKPETRRRNLFCYIDARDLGQIVDRCLATDGLGFQVFNAGNDTNGMNLPTRSSSPASSRMCR